MVTAWKVVWWVISIGAAYGAIATAVVVWVTPTIALENRVAVWAMAAVFVAATWRGRP